MHEFRLSDALRYGLPGGLFLLIAALTYPDISRTVAQDGGLLEATVLAGASLVVGTVIQTLHRAVFYPIVYRFLLVKYVDGRRPNLEDIGSCYTPCQTELRVIEARWRFTAKGGKEPIAHRLADWGAQVHFLFASAWAVMGGAVLPTFAGWTPEVRICALSLIIAVLLVIGALIHDRRLMFVDGRLAGYTREEHGND